MVAIFIFSIGVLAVIGMQAVSIRTAADAKYRADAAFRTPNRSDRFKIRFLFMGFRRIRRIT